MGDDGGRTGLRGWATATAMAMALSGARSAAADAQDLRALAEVQYQHQDRAGFTVPYETWSKSFQVEYFKRLPGAVDFTSRLRFNELTQVGQVTRLRNPEGELRLGHRNFGMSMRFEPNETRNVQSLTTRQQMLSLTGYLQKPGLPSLTGSWIRHHLSADSRSLENTTVTRSLLGIHNWRMLSFHAGYSDRLLTREGSLEHRPAENHANAGVTSQFQIGRAPVSLQYDSSQSHSNPTGKQSYTSRAHMTTGSTSYSFTPRTNAGLNYSYFRNEVVKPAGPLTEDMSGSLALSHSLSRAVTLSSGAGVRTTAFVGRRQLERFLSVSASAQGEARPGWRFGASVNHTQNWLRGVSSRPVDSFESNTYMQLARRLAVRANLGVASADRALAPTGSAGRIRDFTQQAGAGITATPLRTVSLDGNVSRSRTGGSLVRGGGAGATNYTSQVRITPSSRLQLSGDYNVSAGSDSRSVTSHAAVSWSPTSLFQLTANYNRGRNEIIALHVPLAPIQEAWNASVTTALGGGLNASFRYSEKNPRQPDRTRQYSAIVSQRFGR